MFNVQVAFKATIEYFQCRFGVVNDDIFISLASSMLKSLRFTGTVQNLGLTRGDQKFKKCIESRRHVNIMQEAKSSI